MKRTVAIFIILFGLATGIHAQTLHTFSGGTAIFASEMNTNFTNIKAEIVTLKSQVAELQAANAVFPIGAIIASFVAPDANGYMTGSSDVWALADAAKPSGSTYSGTWVDMRGQFIRGMNVSGGADPDNSRVIGSIQGDALNTHRHNLILTAVSTVNPADPIGIAAQFASSRVSQPDYTDSTAGDGSTFSTETRPTNVAVYWYIKVK